MGIFGNPTKPAPKFRADFPPTPYTQRRRWTKEEIKKLIQMWPGHTLVEICTALGRTPSGVGNIVHTIKKMGVKLAPKGMPTGPKLSELVTEVLDELNLPHN